MNCHLELKVLVNRLAMSCNIWFWAFSVNSLPDLDCNIAHSSWVIGFSSAKVLGLSNCGGSWYILAALWAFVAFLRLLLGRNVLTCFCSRIRILRRISSMIYFTSVRRYIVIINRTGNFFPVEF